MKVMIGCPVRNRAWILPQYLAHLQALDFSKEHTEYCFIINDCIDNTAPILEQFAGNRRERVKLVYIDAKNRHGHKRGSYSFSKLAELRNRLLEEFIKSSATHLFSVDSDIMVPPHSLRLLLEDDRDIVSALVCNGYEIGNQAVFNILNRDRSGNYVHLKDIPRKQIFAVECTGAAYLIKRKVIEEHGVRYSSRLGAEDIGFCHAASLRGLVIYCDSRLECAHIMKEPENYTAVKK